MAISQQEVLIGGRGGVLAAPAGARGLVIFAHGSGSSRFSPRNQYVASVLQARGVATLLLDLLTEAEARDRSNVFDIALLAARANEAVDWAQTEESAAGLEIGLFGASTGAAAALVAAAAPNSPVRAVVSRGGRPDLAGDALPRVRAPTLLIVGGLDGPVIDLNEAALARLRCEKALEIVPGAGHLFEEAGTLEKAAALAADWFYAHLHSTSGRTADPIGRGPLFRDRRDAGRRLAAKIAAMELTDPIVLALPRGGAPVAFEIARRIDAPMDVLLVRKIGAPGHPELALGAVMDGPDPQIVVNEEVARALGGDLDAYLGAEAARQLKVIEQRRRAYRADQPAPRLAGRDVIVVDDGVATGATLKVALKGLRGVGPRRVIAAVPVAPAEAVKSLADFADEVICLASPEPFQAVSLAYQAFPQTEDEEVTRLLKESR